MDLNPTSLGQKPLKSAPEIASLICLALNSRAAALGSKIARPTTSVGASPESIEWAVPDASSPPDLDGVMLRTSMHGPVL